MRRSLAQTIFVTLLFALHGASSAHATGAVCEAWGAPTSVGNLGTRALDEVSGMAFSRTQNGVVWMHNDSGDDARFFATAVDGRYLGQWKLKGVRAIDWEDIAIGPCANGKMECLWIADIGNNTRLRKTLQIYRVPEPEVDRDAAPAAHVVDAFETIEFVYGDGEHFNAEALFVAKDGRFWVVTKQSDEAILFEGKVGDDLVRLREVGRRDRAVDLVTAADISPDERRFVIRGYDWAAEFSLVGRSPAEAFVGDFKALRLAVEPQGEAIAYDPSGEALYTTSEERHQPIYRYACLAFDGADLEKVIQKVEPIELERSAESAPVTRGCATGGAMPAWLTLFFPLVLRSRRRNR